jgi:hypothetical protein
MVGCIGGYLDAGGDNESSILNQLINEKGDANDLFEITLEDGEWIQLVYAQSIIQYEGQNMSVSSFIISYDGISPGVKSGGNFTWCTMKIEDSGCYNEDPDRDWILLKWSIIYFVITDILNPLDTSIIPDGTSSELHNLTGNSENKIQLELGGDEWLQVISAESVIQYEGENMSVSSFLISDEGFTSGAEFGGNYSWCVMRIESMGCYNEDPDGDWNLLRWNIVYMIHEVTPQEP